MNSIRSSLLKSWSTPVNRLDWILAGIAATQWAWTKYQTHQLAQKRDIVLSFSDEDAPFVWLMKWLQQIPSKGDLTSFRVHHAPDYTSSRISLPVLVPTVGVEFEYRGVLCSIEKPTADAGSATNTLDSLVQALRRDGMLVRFRTRDVSVCVSFLEEIARLASTKSVPKVQVYSPFGKCWSSLRDVPSGRTAILPGGDFAAIESDLRDFCSAREWYQSVGLPYRRGYLLYGIPGSGKTSLVINLAHEFQLHVLVLMLGELNDQDLIEALRYAPADSVLLFEDVDCAFRHRQSDGRSKITFAGLLNAIDGATTPDGRITFMTTNHRDLLDAALVRPGRVDYEVEFKTACAGQIDELARRFSPTAKNYGTKWAPENISMAEVQNRLIQLYRRQGSKNPKL